jgi:hypothetical protein
MPSQTLLNDLTIADVPGLSMHDVLEVHRPDPADASLIRPELLKDLGAIVAEPSTTAASARS